MVKRPGKNDKLLHLREKANALPGDPGCYLMHDAHGDVIYVGKAKNLKKRVQSYFRDSENLSGKTKFLVASIEDFEFFITSSEAESFILENNLIKQHSPKYNFRLKDGKTYPYVTIHEGKNFPRLMYRRRPRKGSYTHLFGPFPDGSRVWDVIKILRQTYRLRDCSDHEFNSRKNPCLLFQMNQCSAPCVGEIEKPEYRNDLMNVISFFESSKGAKRVLDSIEEHMFELASDEEFERAAFVRDGLEVLREFASENYRQEVERDDDLNCDFIAYVWEDSQISLSIYSIRNGLLLGLRHHFRHVFQQVNDEILIELLVQHYGDTLEQLPSLIVAPFEECDLAEAVFCRLFDADVTVKNKSKSELWKRTEDHAREGLRLKAAKGQGPFEGLKALQTILQMEHLPRRLECFDVAIWQGRSPSASQVVFQDGIASKDLYRQYQLEERPEGNNDFAMLAEMMVRRLEKGKFPDVFVVDGGKGQVGAVLKVVRDFGLDTPVIGIAKARSQDPKTGRERSEERLMLPDRKNPIVLKRHPGLFQLIVSMRDEAHRFSRKLHHKLEKHRGLSTILDKVPGIGQARKRQIYSRIDVPLSQLATLNLEDLGNRVGLSGKVLESLHLVLKQEFENQGDD